MTSRLRRAHAHSGGRDTRTDVVSYRVVAFSHPRVLLARLGTPIARMLQRRFGRESRQAMVQAVADRP